jgi:nucleotide-binding universal stress UspA family protein
LELNLILYLKPQHSRFLIFLSKIDFMKKIVVATDFSAAAANAAEYASYMALALHADLYLMHVASLPVGFSETPALITDEELVHESEKYMSDLKNQIYSKAGDNLHIETEINTGDFINCLVTFCKKVNPYLVVIGSQGKSFAERILFGSHALRTMRQIRWPVIAVPKDASFKLIKKIGLTSDLSNALDSIPLGEIKKMVLDFNAELHIINMGDKDKYNPDTVSESFLLDERLKDIKAEYHFIDSDNKDEGILEYAEQLHIDLLIVLPGHHNFPENLFHKSHTEHFLLLSRIPLMGLHQN